MSKYSIKDLWNGIYGTREKVYDYAGRPMLKSACGNFHSAYQPTIDHTLTGIALLFGLGNAFDSIVSLVAYAFLLKKEKINILKVE